MSELYFDQRWCAAHGIGRFATEVRRRLTGFDDLPLSGSPTDPLDAWKLSAFLRRCKHPVTFFSPGFNVPVWPSCQVVATIHDLIHLHVATESSALKRAYYRFIHRPVIRRAPVTLTVSEYSRQQIIRWYGVPEERVAVVGNGVSEQFHQSGEVFQSSRPYFLYVGNSKPHKNVPGLIKAFGVVSGKHDVELKLVTRASKTLLQAVGRDASGDRVEFVQDIDDRALASLYRGAIALVMPSYHEGFGLPLVEAMACGCPVIGADRTAIPEVIGDAGVLVDPDEADQLVAAMEQSLMSLRLREQMIQAGLRRARDYRWSEVAKRVQTALQRLSH